MLALENICKRYQTRNNTDVVALDNVSLNFQDTGLYFVLGKSGCGKTTLLNVMGSLDSFDSGEMYIDGTPISQLTSNQICNYRNNYLGFVFQEYNLINELTVEENLRIAIDLHAEPNAQLIDSALNKVGLEGYRKRKVSRLSGGQKQRVAIARALIKMPKIILADEPTGNLDSKTSRDIFELLKELSKDICVVVVSHDEESAKLYADNIIEMQDGKIVSCSEYMLGEVIPSSENILPAKKAKHLGARAIFKLAFKNMKKRWIRLAITIVILMLCLSAVAFAFAATYNDSTKIFLGACQKYEQKSVTVLKKENYKALISEGYSVGNSRLNNNDIVQIGSRVDCLIELKEYNTYWSDLLIDKKELLPFKMLLCGPSVDQINQFGMNIAIGRYPLNSNEIMISKIVAEVISLSGCYVNANEEIPVKSYEDLIGKYIGGKKIVGLVDTNPNMLEIEPYINSYTKNPQDINNSRLCIAYENEIGNSIHCAVFVDNDTYTYQLENHVIINYVGYSLFSQEFDYKNGKGIFVNEDFGDYCIVMPFETLKKDYHYLDNGGFNYDYKETYDLDTIDGWNDCLSEHEIFTMINYVDNYNNTVNNLRVRIVSVHKQDSKTIYGNSKISKMLSSNKYEIVGAQIKMSEDYSTNEDFVDWMLEEHQAENGTYVYIPYCGFWGEVERMLQSKYLGWMPVFGTIGIILAIVSVLMIWSFTYTTIIDSKKNIGILLSLGARKVDVSLIYIIESLIIWIVSNILSYTLIPLYRYTFGDINKCIKAFNYTVQDIAIVFVLSLVVIAIGSIFSIVKLIRKNPIEIMRD